jgi:hypothetical protein
VHTSEVKNERKRGDNPETETNVVDLFMVDRRDIGAVWLLAYDRPVL